MFNFLCSGCGKCCHGWLPLTIPESVDFAGRVPLAMVWQLYPRSAKPSPAFQRVSKLSTTVKVGRSEIAVWARPTVFVPPATPCIHLVDGLCGVHASKPARCRTMPFHANLPADQQEPHLVPKGDWPCFNPAEGGVAIYDAGRFLSTEYAASYDAETKALRADASIIRQHIRQTVAGGGADLKHVIEKVAATAGGHLVLPWAAISLGSAMAKGVAAQKSVLAQWIERLRPEAAYHGYVDHYRAFLEAASAVSARLSSSEVAA